MRRPVSMLSRSLNLALRWPLHFICFIEGQSRALNRCRSDGDFSSNRPLFHPPEPLVGDASPSICCRGSFMFYQSWYNVYGFAIQSVNDNTPGNRAVLGSYDGRCRRFDHGPGDLQPRSERQCKFGLRPCHCDSPGLCFSRFRLRVAPDLLAGCQAPGKLAECITATCPYRIPEQAPWKRRIAVCATYCFVAGASCCRILCWNLEPVRQLLGRGYC